jgi:hypothetical protein
VGSYIGFVNDKTNSYVRPPTMTRLTAAEFLSSSHMAPGMMEHFDAYAGVVGLLRKGREIPISGRQPVARTLILNRMDCRSRLGLIRM